MPLLRRRPREVYRVYGAEEFLEGADAHDRVSEPQWDRQAGAGRTWKVALLVAGVAGACALIVARNVTSSLTPTAPRARAMPAAPAFPRARSASHAWRPRSRPVAQASLQLQATVAPTPGRREHSSGVASPAAAVTGAEGRPIAGGAMSGPTSLQPQAHHEFGFEK
jgi:hypothetical protein